MNELSQQELKLIREIYSKETIEEEFRDYGKKGFEKFRKKTILKKERAKFVGDSVNIERRVSEKVTVTTSHQEYHGGQRIDVDYPEIGDFDLEHDDFGGNFLDEKFDDDHFRAIGKPKRNRIERQRRPHGKIRAPETYRRSQKKNTIRGAEKQPRAEEKVRRLKQEVEDLKNQENRIQ